ncbi:EpsG family protein [Thomasclavelia spiroformis]|uniref:EpsG family protein n=1 Tax=Thomasclavelia spiroformis TaxID=29348 RepID=UPI00241C4EA7|nr:EpsG family protein [Thomasclavelia spiroformis]MBS6115840.1 EpsG family protein [Thomasclavelia spiroformis]
MLFLLGITGISSFIYFLGKNQYNKRIKHVSVIFIVLLFSIIAGMRSNIGDTSSYIAGYANYSGSLFTNLQSNALFYYIFYELAGFIWDNSQVIILSTSFIIYPFIIWRFYRQSDDFIMTLVLFVFSNAFVNSMNGIRQYLVAAIIFFFYPKIIKEKSHKWILLILFLTMFHSSVLMMIPVIYFSKQDLWSSRGILFFAFVALIFMIFGKIMPNIFETIENTKYSVYQYDSYGTTGVNIFRILFTLIPVSLAFFFRNSKKMKSTEIIFLSNMTIFNFIFMLFGYYGAVYARFCLYFELYPLILIPKICNIGFKNNGTRNVIKVIIYIIYFLFLYYQIQISWSGLTYKSNILGITI